MSLQFIRGTSDTKLDQVLLNATVHWLDKEEGNEVFYIVPNHRKFEQEINLLKQLKEKQKTASDTISTTRMQVFSFYRLAWYYLQNTNYYRSELLSEAGAAMIFRKILNENMEKLNVFHGEVNKSGFIQQLFELYEEMNDGNIAVDDLKRIACQNSTEMNGLDLKLKMQDLQLIFSKFDEQMTHYDIHSPKIIDYLTSYLKQQDLKHVLFVISGYHHFSARELKLLEVLMERGGEVKISLILDKKYPNQLPAMHDLFFETGTTYNQLYQLARKNHVEILSDYHEQTDLTGVSQSIEKLQNYWVQSQQNSFVKEKEQIVDSDVQIWCAENPKEEITAIAKEIRRLVVEKKYRYSDIQLLTRELDIYEPLLAPIFSMYDIPLYLDRDMAMEQHPIVAFIQSLFAIHTYNYKYRDVLRFLRTELFIPTLLSGDLSDWLIKRDDWRRKVDITENVVLAYGYEGFYWTQTKDWQFVNYDFEEGEKEDTQLLEKESNEIRQSIQKYVVSFFKKIEQVSDGREGAKLFYQFLVDSGVEQQLMMWRTQAIEQGMLEEARNHEQTWQALMDLLDEYVVIYGNTSFELKVFQDIFSSGLEGLRYNKVPTAIDQVQVRSIDLCYSGQAKIVFAIGVTDQVLPKKIENKTLLSDEERTIVNERLTEDCFLFNDSRKSIAKEPFQAYLLFSAATDFLFFSYPSVQDTTKNVKLSPYLARAQKALNIPIKQKKSLTIFDDESTSLQHIATYRTLISDFIHLKRQKLENQQPLLPFWLGLEQLLMQGTQQRLASHIFGSLTHKNIPKHITEDLAESLYGKTIYTSVSRMESFYHCQYQYFSRYGLKLKERARYELSSAATGEFYHEALDLFFKLVINSKRQLSEFTEQEVEQLTEQMLSTIFSEGKFSILTSSSRMNYLRYQLSQTIKKVSWALRKQSERSGMSTVQTEILFGQLANQTGIKGIELPLKNNGKISVRGKIDRLDQLVTPEATYLSVIDYKSSHKKFNMMEAYSGLAMQMLTYLDVALMDAVSLIGQPAKAAGSLYLHIQNPTLPFVKSDQVEKQLLKKFQYDGLLLKDEILLENLDRSLQAKETSLLYPIEESAKEIIKPGRRQEDKFVTESELALLLTHNRGKFVEAGNKIISGDIALNPAYQGKERIACRYCPFRSVCNFDVMLQENKYNRIEQLSKKEIMHLLSNESNENLVKGEDYE